MANIDKLNYSFVDGQTTIHDYHLNEFVDRINRLIDAVGGSTPTQVARPTITITGSTATISCSTSGATIRYTTNGNNPTTTSGTIIASGGTVSLQSACTIKAIAYKDGMTTSEVASQPYSPSVSPEAQAALAKFSNLSSAQQTKVKNFVDTLVSNNIYSKVHYLSLPLVASTVPEALQNILNDVTPPTVESGVINNGLFTAELVDLTALVTTGMDYDDYSLAYGVEIDTAQQGTTADIVRFAQSTSASATRVYHEVNLGRTNCIGYKANGHQGAIGENNIAVQINSHDKANSVEKWFSINTGELTSGADDGTTIPTNNGLFLNNSSTSTTYHVKFTGKIKLLLLSDCLTDAQLNALKSAIDTFLA